MSILAIIALLILVYCSLQLSRWLDKMEIDRCDNCNGNIDRLSEDPCVCFEVKKYFAGNKDE